MNKAAETSMPRKEYSEIVEPCEPIVLNNKFEYRTEKEALAATWVQINESFPRV
jgi:hypothetical protein